LYDCRRRWRRRGGGVVAAGRGPWCSAAARARAPARVSRQRAMC